jgi:hypothetical protein
MEELLKELEEVKQKIADIEKKIEEKKMETGRWKPEEGDTYWFVTLYGQAAHDIWDNELIDNKRYEIGDLFKTKEEAEFAIEKLKVIAELKEYEEPKDREWDGVNLHYYFYYNCGMKEIGIACNYSFKSEHIYFESKEKAEQAIDSIDEKRIKKYYLEVQE